MNLQKQYNEILNSHFHKHVIIPELANEISLEASVVIQQIHYWLQKCGKLIEGQLWIYNTFEQWQENFRYWSVSKIKKIFYSLEKRGLIYSKKMNVQKSDHTKWYTLNYEAILDLMEDLVSVSFYINENEEIQEKNIRTYDICGEDGYYTTNKDIRNININISRDIISEDNDTIAFAGDVIRNNNSDFINENNSISDVNTSSNPSREEKKFPLCQSELSSCQIDTIIYSYTKNNLQETNYLNKQKDFLNFKKAISQNTDEETFTESENEVCKAMIGLWKRVFSIEHEICLTSKRKRKLLNVWRGLMQESKEKWEDFCIKISSSKFLMGEKKEGFKASFDWLLLEEIAKRVLSNEFGIGDRKDPNETMLKEKRLEEKRTKVSNLVEKLEENEKQVFESIMRVVGSRYFESTHLKAFENEFISEENKGDKKMISVVQTEEAVNITIKYRDCFTADLSRARVTGHIEEAIKKAFSQFNGNIFVDFMKVSN